MDVNGARVLITGGASGLGGGTAARLASQGATVGILDLPTTGGADAAAELGGFFAAADVREPEQVAAAVGEIAEALGGLDVCVNAAGVANAARVINRKGELFPLDLFEFVVGVNLIGTFDVLRNAVEVMAANEPDAEGGRGLVVNVASIAATEGQVGQAAYSASKGGVAAMTLPLARDLASLGIRVMAIAPGIMDTPMIAGMPDEVRESLAKIHVFPQRLGTPEDFARLVQHFMENTLLNGEVVRLDAGARMMPR
jgi:3-hydroxyacyl-CoA dehydrogenase/3-hydroxy-2-methylbutyryl-CoA dehydrogenase